MKVSEGTMLKSQRSYCPSPGLVTCSSTGFSWLFFINLTISLHRGNLSFLTDLLSR